MNVKAVTVTILVAQDDVQSVKESVQEYLDDWDAFELYALSPTVRNATDEETNE